MIGRYFKKLVPNRVVGIYNVFVPFADSPVATFDPLLRFIHNDCYYNTTIYFNNENI